MLGLAFEWPEIFKVSHWHLKKNPASDSKQEHSQDQLRYRKMRNVSVVGVIANVFLCITKITMGLVAQSQALIADGIHSLADAMTDVAVIVTARYSNQKADAGHPYGHARFETAATAGLGVILIVTGLGITIDAGQRLIDPALLFQPTAWALIAAFLSIAINEGLYQYTRIVGEKIKSALVIANAWHHRTDALSSVVVMVGVSGVLMGWESLDAIAAVVVAFMIIHVGWGQLQASFRELVDAGVPGEKLLAITEVIEGIEGVSHPHRLRTRRMGEHVLVDVHVEVPPRISVSEGHQLAELVQKRLTDELDDVSDVVVHIDPRGQEAVWLELPNRDEICSVLKAQWQQALSNPDLSGLDTIVLHYLDGGIDVEVIWDKALETGGHSHNARALIDGLKAPVQAIPEVRSIEVLLKNF